MAIDVSIWLIQNVLCQDFVVLYNTWEQNKKLNYMLHIWISKSQQSNKKCNENFYIIKGIVRSKTAIEILVL